MQKQELLKALEAVKPGLAKNDLIEQTTSFAFMKERVVTFNDEISVSYPIDIGITGAVKAEELYTLLHKIVPKKDDQIDIEQAENEIRIHGKRITAGVKLQNEINLPLDEVDEIQEEWNPVPADLSEALKLCAFSTSKDMSRPVLTCLCCSAEKGAVYSSDSYRISKRTLEGLKQSFLIPATVASELVKYNFTYYQVRENWAHFKDEDGTLFSFRTIEGQFPIENVEEYLQKKGKNSIKFPTGMKDALDRAHIFTKQDLVIDQKVQIEIKGNHLTCTGRGEYGWLTEKMKIENKAGQDCTFLINPDFLRQILNLTNEFSITESFIRFTGKEFTHLLALVNDENE